MKKYFPLRLEPDLIKRLDRLAEKLNIKRSEIARIAISEYVNRLEK